MSNHWHLPKYIISLGIAKGWFYYYIFPSAFISFYEELSIITLWWILNIDCQEKQDKCLVLLFIKVKINLLILLNFWGNEEILLRTYGFLYIWSVSIDCSYYLMSRNPLQVGSWVVLYNLQDLNLTDNSVKVGIITQFYK